jgi:hypothetical protein
MLPVVCFATSASALCLSVGDAKQHSMPPPGGAGHSLIKMLLPCRFGIGAIAEGGQSRKLRVIINAAAVEAVGATQQQLQDIIHSETRELQRRVQVYRKGRSHLPVAGKFHSRAC